MRIERGDVGVGLTVAAGVALALVAWLWLTRPSDDYFPIFVEYDRVESLGEQTPVRLQGFSVGRIQSIRPQTSAEGSVVFRVELRVETRFLGDSALLIPEGTVARIQYPPVVGSPYVVLETPPEGGRPLEPGATVPGLRTEPFLDQIQVLTGQLSFTVSETLTRAMTLMDSVERTLGRLDRTMTSAEAEIPRILVDLRASVQAAEELTRRVEAELDETTPALQASIDSASALIGHSRRVIGQVETLMESTQPRTELVLANLDSATYMLNHLVTRLAQKPLRLFTGVGPPPPMIRRQR